MTASHPHPVSPPASLPPAASCPLCLEQGGRVVWQGAYWRLVYVDEPGEVVQPAFAAFYRLICHRHAAEWTDLTDAERNQAMQCITLVEQAMRACLQPDKVNLASLGNVVPHMHWHIVARFAWDSHYPNPIWAGAVRTPDHQAHAAVLRQIPALEENLRQQLQQMQP